ncbi:MAG: DUF3881 family protein [Clostridiales bacterium]|nr:DUF3881 family protein [Clostridiales bacterium]
MHSYNRAIGFKGIEKKKDFKKILSNIIEYPDETRVTSTDEETNMVEIRKEFADGIGILVYGHYREDSEFEIEYYIPYIKGINKQLGEEISITRHISRESFSGICEDMRVGISLIYYLQNGMDYIENQLKEKKSNFHTSMWMSGLSTSGTIILPVSKNENQIQRHKIANMNRKNLLSAAKKGDEDAIESLTMEDLDTYSRISKRIIYEDVFSIVDSSFMPYGVECDQYTVVGDITELKLLTNSYTKELVYFMNINCNDFKFNLAINKEDLLGEPEVGRRFKGTIWLQARVDF